MSNTNEVAESEILRLWRDITFPGSFRGIKTFQAVLKTDKNINVSQNKLFQILRKEPLYLIHQLKPFKWKTRKTITHNYGELVQADVAHMFEDESTKAKYFLLLIDVFSNKIFVEILKNKESASVAKALQNIFTRFGSPIYEIQTDKGKEFTGSPCKALFKTYNILFRTKRGLSKASFAESAIFRVKRKLYIYLRSQLSKQWSKYIPEVVESLNNIPLKRLGFLAPNTIKNVSSSVEVDSALKANQIEVEKEPTFDEQNQNQAKYKAQAQKNSNLLKTGDYVYLRLKNETFNKSFDIQVKFSKTNSPSIMFC